MGDPFKTPARGHNTPLPFGTLKWDKTDPIHYPAPKPPSSSVHEEVSLPILSISPEMAERLSSEFMQEVCAMGFRWIEMHVKMFRESYKALYNANFLWTSDSTCTSPMVPHLAKWYFARFLLTTSDEVINGMMDNEKDPEQTRIKEWIRRHTQICVGLASKMDEETPVSMDGMVLSWRPQGDQAFVGDQAFKDVKKKLIATEAAVLKQLGWQMAVPHERKRKREEEP